MSPQQNRIVVLMLSFFAQISPRRGTRMKIPNLHANKLSNLRYFLLLFVLFAGLPFRASAQDATIVGTVTDQSGSVTVPTMVASCADARNGKPANSTKRMSS